MADKRTKKQNNPPEYSLNRRKFLAFAGLSTAASLPENSVFAERLSSATPAMIEFRENEKDLSTNYINCKRRLGPDWNLLPFHEMRVDKIDPEKYVKNFAEANVDCIFQYVKGCWGYSIYDTRVGIKHPYLKTDLLKGILNHAHARGVKVQAYYCLCFDNAILKKHPEWRMVDAKGDLISVRLERRGIPGSGWHRACFNTSYRQYVLEQITEIARDYDVDMIWIDILNQGDAGTPGCYCKLCQEQYKKQYGIEIPRQANWDQQWKQMVKWRVEVIDKFWREIVSTIHKYKPGLPVCRNYEIGRSRVHSARLVEGEKFIHGEDGQPESLIRSHVASLIRGMSGGQAFHFSINSCWQPEVGLFPSYERFRVEAIGNLAFGAISTIGHGVSAFYPDKNFGNEDFQRIAPAFKEYAQKEKHIEGAQAIPYIGTLFTDATWMFYAQDDFAGRFERSLHGTSEVLLRLQLPFNVVPEWMLNTADLKKHKIIILPNLAAMSQEQAKAIKAYVAEGGLLLATFESSLYDENGNQLGDFQLGEVFGLQYIGISYPDPEFVQVIPQSFVSPTQHIVFKGLPKAPLKLGGPYVRTKAVRGETIAFQRDPELVNYEGKKVLWSTLPGEVSSYPAIHFNRFGKGKALFVTSELFRQCFPNGINSGRSGVYVQFPELWWSRKLVGNMLQFLDQNPPIWVEGPATVEATFWNKQSQNQILVQLLNKTDRDTEIPVGNIKILVSKGVPQPKEAYLPWPTKKPLLIKEEKDRTEVSISSIGLHEMVVLQY